MTEEARFATLHGFIRQDTEKTVAAIEREAAEQYAHERDQHVRAESEKLEAQFEKRMKQIGVERHVAKVNAAKSEHLRLLDFRNEQLDAVRALAHRKIAALVSGAGYTDLLRRLLLQAALAVEADCTVRVRKADEGAVRGMLAELEAAVAQKLGKKVSLKLDGGANLDDDEAWGGAILSGLNGRIVCNNTLSYRASNAFAEQLPTMRHLLFHEMATA